MYIRHICYPVTTLGPGQRLGIWFSGCLKNCNGCMSEDLKMRRESDWVELDKVKSIIRGYAGMIDGATISGGEPFDQPSDLALLVEFLVEEICEDILVYSGYALADIKRIPESSRVLNCITTLIDGEYIQTFDNGAGLRGSTNQKVIWLNDHKAFSYENAERRRQYFVFGENALAIGLRDSNG